MQVGTTIQQSALSTCEICLRMLLPKKATVKHSDECVIRYFPWCLDLA